MKTRTIALLTLGGIMFLLVTMALAPPAFAYNYTWNDNTGTADWTQSSPNPWTKDGGTSQTPTSSDWVTIGAGRTATISGSDAALGNVVAVGGGTGYGHLIMTGGSLTATAGGLYINSNNPVMDQSGGTVTVGVVSLYNSGSTYNLSGSGILNINYYMMGGPGGTFNMSGNSVINYYDNGGTNGWFGNQYVFTATGGTVNFLTQYASRPITSAGRAFNNVAFNGSGSWILQDNLTANGNFAVQQGSLNANSKTVSVSGNFSQTGGTLSNANVVLQGGGNQAISRTAGTLSGGSWTVSKTANTLAYQTTALSLPGSLTINSGIWNTNGNALTVSGAFANNSVFRTNGNEALNFTKDTDSGLVEYMGHAGSSMNYGNVYYDLRIATTAGSADLKPSVSSDLIVNRNLEVVRGTLDTNGKNVSIGGALNVSIGTFRDTAGSVVTLGGPTHTVTGGTLQVDGTLSGTGKNLDVSSTGTLKGTGTLTGLNTTVSSGGTLSPGNSPGTMTISGGTMTWGPDAHVLFQVYDAAGTAGTGWDLLQFTNGASIDVTATSDHPVIFEIQGLSAPDTIGVPLNYDSNATYSWLFIDPPDFFGNLADMAKYNFMLKGFTSANPFRLEQITGTNNFNLTNKSGDVPEIPAGLMIPMLGMLGTGLIFLRKKFFVNSNDNK